MFEQKHWVVAPDLCLEARNRDYQGDKVNGISTSWTVFWNERVCTIYGLKLIVKP